MCTSGWAQIAWLLAKSLTTVMRQGFIDDLRRLGQGEHRSSFSLPQGLDARTEPDELVGPRGQPGRRPTAGWAIQTDR
jgi:hypothetical protein